MSSSNNSVVYWGTGRRKTSVARVRLVPGTGTITIKLLTGDCFKLDVNPEDHVAIVKEVLHGILGQREGTAGINCHPFVAPHARKTAHRLSKL